MGFSYSSKLGDGTGIGDDGFSYNPVTDTLDVGTLTANNVVVTALATPTVTSVTPTLTQVGTINVVAGASLADGDYFTVDYGSGTIPIEFEATPPNGTTGGRIPFTFAAGDSAGTIRDGLIALINLAAPTKVVASIGGAAAITVSMVTPGEAGGVITENVANAGFTVAGFANPTAATTYGYKAVSYLADGTSTAASTEVTTAAGHATLSASNFVTVVFAPSPGSTSTRLYRTTGGTAPPKLLYTGTATSYVDTGAAGTAQTPSTVNGTGTVTAGNLTAGRVPIVGTGGLITDDAGLTYDATVGGIQQVNKVVPKSDLNSLVNSDVSAGEWIYDETSTYTAPVSKTATGVRVNPSLLAAVNYYYRGVRAWVCPPGVTSVTFTVNARKVPGDASAVMRTSIGDASAVPISTTDHTLTDSFADYSVTAAVTAGTAYMVHIFARHVTMAAGAAQRFEVSSARLVPNTGTGVFAASFVRYAVTPSVVGNSYGWAWTVSRRAYDQSPFATLTLATDASALAIEYVSDIYGTFPAWANIGVQESGQAASVLTVTANQTPKISALSLVAAGTKTLNVWGGATTKPASAVLGTRAVAVYAPATAAVTVTRTPASLVVYGDSIMTGGNTTSPPTEAWPMLLRPYLGGRVATHGWGYASLNDDAADAAARAAFARKLVSYGAHRYWFAIGTNDYGLNKWTAAAFGTAYAALLDELKGQDPLAQVYCQTPIVRATETANGSGSTLGDYRVQIIAVAASRSPWAVAVDGQSFMAAASLDDGTHPTTAGHVLYAAAVRAVLGL